MEDLLRDNVGGSGMPKCTTGLLTALDKGLILKQKSSSIIMKGTKQLLESQKDQRSLYVDYAGHLREFGFLLCIIWKLNIKTEKLNVQHY